MHNIWKRHSRILTNPKNITLQEDIPIPSNELFLLQKELDGDSCESFTKQETAESGYNFSTFSCVFFYKLLFALNGIEACACAHPYWLVADVCNCHGSHSKLSLVFCCLL